MQNPWISCAAALTGAAVAVLLWFAKEARERKKAGDCALSLLAYFAHSLSKALPHGAEQMGHVDLAILNSHIHTLMEFKDLETALYEIHDRYYKWRIGGYKGQSATSPEMMREQAVLASHCNTAKELLRQRQS